jgi:DNA-binding CsgD family transcriptional regulator
MIRAQFVLAEVGAVADALAAMEEAGASIVRGWQLPDEPWDLARRHIACAGRITTRTDLEDALLAAARGASLVVEGPVPAELSAPLVEDLRRLGVVEHRCSDGLDVEQRRILTLLGEGFSVREAADQLFISRRTADRRLAAARAELGVGTNNEAVVAVARHASGEGPERHHRG